VVVADDVLGDRGYDVTPDGRVVAAVGERPATAAQHIEVVLNWFLEMKSPATRSEPLAAHHSR